VEKNVTREAYRLAEKATDRFRATAAAVMEEATEAEAAVMTDLLEAEAMRTAAEIRAAAAEARAEAAVSKLLQFVVVVEEVQVTLQQPTVFLAAGSNC
jgi:hypothetical protein